jgi:hypothetical protein
MSHDLRQYARQTNTRLVIGFIVILLVIGVGLILLFYGKSAALTGLFCLLAALVPVLMVLLAFWIIDLVLKANKMK